MKLSDIDRNVSNVYVSDLNFFQETVNYLETPVASYPLCVSASRDGVDLKFLCRPVGYHRDSRARVQHETQRFVAAVYTKLDDRAIADDFDRYRCFGLAGRHIE